MNERPRRRTGRRMVAAAFAILVLTIGGVVVWNAIAARRPAATAGRAARAPQGARIRVEVLNATPTRGRARRATQLLRDRGFDVVSFGTAPERRDSTLVLDRSGHPDWAAAVAAALETGRTEARPDSSRYLDVTVLLGADWRPPAKPFYP